MDKFGKAVSMDELCKAAKECRRGVSNKVGPVEFNLHRLSSCKRLKDDIISGRYKIRPGTKVIVYRPKRRVATAPWFRDRVWQRSMCNNGVYEDLTRSFILENIACQKGKGADMAIRRVVKMLQRLHRKEPGATVYGVHLDVKKYFPSTPHDELKEMDKRRISEKRFLPFLYEIIESNKDERPREEIDADPFGERGTGLGSQINQLHQIALLDPMDHDLKCICRDYIRYNDDILILSHDRQVIERARGAARDHLAKIGLIMTDKAGIFKAENGFYFLRKRFIMKRCVDYGLRTMEDVRHHYQSWIANAEYAGDAPIRAMDKFYAQLFRERPQYKRKKRYLYGNNPETRGKARKSGTRKQDAQERECRSESEDRLCGDLRLSGDAGGRRGGAE